jgi:hypothetical protein
LRKGNTGCVTRGWGGGLGAELEVELEGVGALLAQLEVAQLLKLRVLHGL